MKSVLLQEFTPEGASAPDYETRSLDNLLAGARAEGYEAGVQAGTEASAAAHAESQDMLRAELIEVLRDQQIGQQESQAAVLRGVAPVVLAVIRRLAPRLAEAGLADHVEDALQQALQSRPDPVPVIRCAADSAQGLELALAGWEGEFRIETDPRLTPLEAQLHWDSGFDAINLNGLLDEIEQALAAALTPAQHPGNEKELVNG